MPTDVRYLVGAPSTPYSDGQPYQPRMGRLGDTIVSEFRGKYGEACQRGQIYHYGTGPVNQITGVTIPIYTATAQTFGLRNPPGSNVILELIRLEIGYLSGADVPGNLVFTVPPVNAGVTATGSGGVTAATLTAGQSGQLAGTAPAPVSKCKIMTAITSVAPTVVLRTLGFSTETALAASTNAAFWQVVQFDGTDMVYPGADLFLAASVAAAIGVCIINVVGMEVPYSA